MSKKTFTNELGNTITVQVFEKEIEGVPGILLAIAGPTSDTEIHITRLESRVVYEELGRVLSADKRDSGPLGR